jgi:hypothetical protein
MCIEFFQGQTDGGLFYEAISPSKKLGCQYKSVANFTKYDLIVFFFKFGQSYIKKYKIITIPNLYLFLL